MSILDILSKIANEPSTNRKMEILSENKENELLKKVIYLAESPRIKFYIKQVPDYSRDNISEDLLLEGALEQLQEIYTRQITGNEAIYFLSLILSKLHPDDATVVERIVKKDLRIGMGSKNINKVIKNFIEETPYMGAVPFNKKVAEDIVKNGCALSQIKMDGRYANCIIADNTPYLESRAGETTHLPITCKLMKELSTISSDVVLCGEITMGSKYSRYEANGIVASIVSICKKAAAGESIIKEIEKFEKERGNFQEKCDELIYTVWDVIKIEEYDQKSSKVQYRKRLLNAKELIEGLESIQIVESKEVHTYQEVLAHFAEVVAQGHEGTILKDGYGTWKDGKPKYQCKIKLDIDVDLEIVDFNWGTPGTKNENVISSIQVQSSDGLLKTNPGGIDEKTMDFITKNMEGLRGEIVKIKCSGISQNSKGEYSLLHPRFVEFRDDKSEADSLERIIEIELMAKGLK